ncbi:MAG: DNA polymerase IV [Erysipelotrichaceae bacterium]|nr:DNA polymerase IV [Erysipelotrichaceae bacterium]
MERVILHCDLNGFYASVECLHHPEIRNRPVAVGGDVDKRHGIILAKNQAAKKYKIQTGEALWQARIKCPELIIIKPHFDTYLRFSAMVRAILADYSDLIEPFGIDEAWIDVTHSAKLLGSGEVIADTIRQRIREEIGITASIGVSFNKIFAKLGSDLKKPDATTIISKENMKEVIFPLPASELLYVGKSTSQKLAVLKINTIGDIAEADLKFLKQHLGKQGEYLWLFANGLESSPVSRYGADCGVKSIGNSTTTPRDLIDMEDVKVVAYVLSESVGARLREQGLKARTISISVRDTALNGFTRQHKLNIDTDCDKEIAETAIGLFSANTRNVFPLRSIGVSATELSHGQSNRQLSLFIDNEMQEKEHKLDLTVDLIRKRYGFSKIKRGILLTDPVLSTFNPKDDHVIFPVSYY